MMSPATAHRKGVNALFLARSRPRERPARAPANDSVVCARRIDRTMRSRSATQPWAETGCTPLYTMELKPNAERT